MKRTRGARPRWHVAVSAMAALAAANVAGAEPSEPLTVRLRLSVTTPLEYANTPLDPRIDFPRFLREAALKGVLDPNSIELHNVTGTAVDIGGWFLSDSSDDLLKYEIPQGTIIEPFGYIVFSESNFNPAPARPGPKDFALSGSQGDDVWLVVHGEPYLK